MLLRLTFRLETVLEHWTSALNGLTFMLTRNFWTFVITDRSIPVCCRWPSDLSISSCDMPASFGRSARPGSWSLRLTLLRYAWTLTRLCYTYVHPMSKLSSIDVFRKDFIPRASPEPVVFNLLSTTLPLSIWPLFPAPLTLNTLQRHMYSLVNLLIKLSYVVGRVRARALLVENHWPELKTDLVAKLGFWPLIDSFASGLCAFLPMRTAHLGAARKLRFNRQTSSQFLQTTAPALLVFQCY